MRPTTLAARPAAACRAALLSKVRPAAGSPMKLFHRLMHFFQLPGYPSPDREPELGRGEVINFASRSGFLDIGFQHCSARHQLRQPHSITRFADQQGNALRRRRRFENAQAFLRRAAGRGDIQNNSASDGDHGREHAHDETIARQQQQRLAQQQAGCSRGRPGRSGSVPRSRRTSASTSAVPA